MELPDKKGRGRGRRLTPAAESSSVSIPSATAAAATANVSSSYDDVQPRDPPQTIKGGGRGRGAHLKRYVKVPEPHQTAQDPPSNQCERISRCPKPTEVGKIGQQIKVIVNYFPIVKFPDSGFVYQYHIDIRNTSDIRIPRQYRRILYECWLKKFRETHQNIDRYKIVFDNEMIILVYGQMLPDIDETGIKQVIMGPNRAGFQAEYQIHIKRVGSQMDLSLLRSIKEFYINEANNNINLDELQNVKKVLSILLHEHCSSKAEFINNRSFFSHPSTESKYGEWDLGLGKALWRGFYSCLVFAKGYNQLLMNLDVSHGVFMKKQPFLDFLCEVMLHSPRGRKQYGRNENISKIKIDDVLQFLDQNDSNGYDYDERKFLLKHCKGLRVRPQNSNGKIVYQIIDLGEGSSTQKFVWSKKNKEITVEAYYKENYGLDLQYPTLPTLKMRGESFVPMELVIIEPARKKQITDEQRALLCLNSTMRPIDYYNSVQEVRRSPQQQCFEQDPFVSAWKLNVDIEMLQTSARILPMPDINYSDKHCITDQQCRTPGVWKDMKMPFHKPADFPSVWAMINLSSSTVDEKASETFYNELRNFARQRGIHKCPEPVIYEEYIVTANTIQNIIHPLKELMRKNDKCAFFIIILPEDSTIRDKVYDVMKNLCELQDGLGIVSQMVQAKTFAKNNRQGNNSWDYSTLNNILMKINTKLNGINSVLHVSSDIEHFFSKGHQIMYVGIDLSHAAPGSPRKRSAVAVVASADDVPNRYFKEIYVQERLSKERKESLEYIVDMELIMKSLIGQYKLHRGYPPKAIVIYRDGISESEFDTVFPKELTAIRNACVELCSAYQPYLTYIVVNKRHHTRFFPTDSYNNVKAGTVVDSPDVTNPTTYDFFLNSHYAEKGTSRPTHYHVLYDDNKLQPDQVQMLTYALCYTYTRCSRSISIPTPVKYADLLAYRVSKYININDEFNKDLLIPINQSVEVENGIKSDRIILSSKLAADCPFFL